VLAIRFARGWRAGAALLLVLSFRPGVAGGACRSVAADGGVALILSGGGAKGAYEAGVAAAFVDSGAPLRLVAGSSAGALTAAMIADGRIDRLEKLWRTITREQVYLLRPSVVFAGLLPGWVALATLNRAGSLFDAGPLRTLIGTSLDLDRIRASPVRLVVVATDLERQQQRVFDNDTITVDALLAASAMPGVFPPVEVEGRLLVDGGLTGRAPVLDALAADSSVQRAVVVVSYAAGERGGRPTTARRAVEAAFEMAMVNQIERDTELARLKYPAVEIGLLTPSAPLALRPLEFDPVGIARAIELGKADALACLATPGQQRAPGSDQDRSRP
jgi:NTE family protein